MPYGIKKSSMIGKKVEDVDVPNYYEPATVW